MASNKKNGAGDLIYPGSASGGQTAGLDLDGGSVMSEMLALFTPPGRGDSKGRSGDLNPRTVELHPYFKRPGKGHNNDNCDACGEGGDLICCDNCPASFHFSCHAPPLDEDEIPMGDWTCIACYRKHTGRTQAIRCHKQANTFNEQQQEEEEEEKEEEKPEPERPRPLRGNSASKKSNGSEAAASKKYKLKYEKYLRAKPWTNSPFDALISAALVMDTEQFQLPPELDPKESLPFSWKWSEERQEDFESHPKKCARCAKINRNMPAVQCDFCPQVYHLDCLDPPLCDVPKERWMCPDHVENFIDSNVVKSTSLTERLNLWTKYARCKVDPDSVRLEFFRKVRSGKLYQSGRPRKTQVQYRIKVPQFIKNQYKNPLPGYPQESAVPIIPSFPPRTATDSLDRKDEKDMEEEAEFLRNLVAMQTSVLKHQVEAKKRKLVQENEDGDLNRASPAPSEEGTVSNCSLNFEDQDEGENEFDLSPELREKLNEFLAVAKKKCPQDPLKKMPKVVKDVLATQRLDQLFEKEREENSGQQVRAKAALTSLNSTKAQALMRYRSLEIGLGTSGEIEGPRLDLTRFGHCRFISSKHAVIYFDQLNQVYELINYSEHGTIVDNVVYALEPRKLPRKSNTYATMATGIEKQKCYCECSTAKTLQERQGCENSAILKHGSYIRIGCLQFVFSILDFEADEISVPLMMKDTLKV